MERAEAEAVLDGDLEAAVALLLRVGELIEANRRLEARVAELERRLKAELAELVAAALAGSAFGVGAVAGGIVVASRRPRGLHAVAVAAPCDVRGGPSTGYPDRDAG